MSHHNAIICYMLAAGQHTLTSLKSPSALLPNSEQISFSGNFGVVFPGQLAVYKEDKMVLKSVAVKALRGN